MRPASVSSSEIIRAGFTLQQQGKAINGYSLRQQVGGGNPKRLLKIWHESGAIVGQPEAMHVHVSNHPSAPTPEPPAPPLDEVTKASTLHAAELEREVQELKAKLDQSSLVNNAVLDELNRTKLRCAQLEAKEKQQEQRIAELHARIDEQRGELNRGSQARISLQRALDALTAAAST